MEHYEELGVPQSHGPLASTVSASPEKGNPLGVSITQKRSIRASLKRLRWRHLLIVCVIIALLVVVIAVSVHFGKRSNTEEDGRCLPSAPRVKLDYIHRMWRTAVRISPIRDDSLNRFKYFHEDFYQKIWTDPDFAALIAFFWPWSSDMEDTKSPMFEETISKTEYWVTKIFQTSSLSSCIKSSAMEMMGLGGNILVHFKLYVSCDSAAEVEINRAYIEGHSLLQRTQDKSCVVSISKNIYLEKWRKNIIITDMVTAPRISNTTCGQSQLYPVPKIVGGRPVKRGQYPWVVELGIESYTMDTITCGGTIWDYNHILTAAHCFEMLEWNTSTGLVKHRTIYVTAGKWQTLSTSHNQQYRSVASARIHTGFDVTEHMSNDIALLKLAKPLHPTQLVMKVCHPDASTQLPNKGIVAGWGQTKAGLDTFPEVQQSVELIVLNQSDCCKFFQLLNSKVKPQNGTLCTIDDDLEERDNCQGDSGGPLFANLGTRGDERYTIFGIVSYGLVCGRSPAIYASVGYYLDWIQDTIQFLKRL